MYYADIILVQRKKNSMLKLYVTYEFGFTKYFDLFTLKQALCINEERGIIGTSHSLILFFILYVCFLISVK